MPKIKIDMNLPDSASAQQMTDAMVKFAREMEWLMDGNLDADNIKSMQFQSATVTGTVRFEGDVTLKGGTALGTIAVNNSSAPDLTQLKNDFNQLLQVLRDYNILNG